MFLIGGIDRRLLGSLPRRPPGARHILGRRAHPLRAVRRRGVHALRRHSTTGSQDVTGRMLSETLGKLAFWLMFDRLPHHVPAPARDGPGGRAPARVRVPRHRLRSTLYNLISTVGSFILALGVLVSSSTSSRSLKHGAIAGPDPWKGNTLEWFTTSPPPVNNFDVIPRVNSVEPMKDYRREIERLTQPAAVPAGASAGGGEASPSGRLGPTWRAPRPALSPRASPRA